MYMFSSIRAKCRIGTYEMYAIIISIKLNKLSKLSFLNIQKFQTTHASKYDH